MLKSLTVNIIMMLYIKNMYPCIIQHRNIDLNINIELTEVGGKLPEN